MKNLLDFKSFCESLYAKERSSQKIQELLSNRFRIKSGMTMMFPRPLRERGKSKRKELINKPSPAFVVFANVQTQLLPLLDLLQARRVSPTERCSCRLNLLAIRTCFAPSVRKSALTKREGVKNHFLTSLPTNLLTFKAAFTLAEVLITLGIIGVVAALTIPGLLTNIQHRDYTVKLKKFYSTMKQVTMSAEEEFGPVNSWNRDLPMSTYVMTYLSPFLKFSIIKGTETTRDIEVAFTDGTILTIYRGSCMDLIYDVNGSYHPNKEGYDKFRFLFCPEGVTDWCGDKGFCTYVLNVDRKKNSRQVLLQSCKNEGRFCSGLLEYDNWVFNKDYPYLK